MCEKRGACGFYGWLKENGYDSGCPKPDPASCPRFQYNNGINKEQSRKIFKVPNIYTLKYPRTNEEVQMAKDLDLLNL